MAGCLSDCRAAGASPATLPSVAGYEPAAAELLGANLHNAVSSYWSLR
jgi:hypothetical protein